MSLVAKKHEQQGSLILTHGVQDSLNTDIYQILSYCLSSLKRKIILYLKIDMQQKNLDSQPAVIESFIKQHEYSLKIMENWLNTYSSENTFSNTMANYKCLLKDNSQYLKATNQDKASINAQAKNCYESLYQRFIYRIKELVRNYIPYISNRSHQIFIYLKKIENYQFKQHDQGIQGYLRMILEEHPKQFQNIVTHKMEEQLDLAHSSPVKKSTSKPYDNYFVQNKVSSICIQEKFNSKGKQVSLNRTFGSMTLKKAKQLKQNKQFSTATDKYVETTSVVPTSDKNLLKNSQTETPKLLKPKVSTPQASSNQIISELRPLDEFNNSIKSLSCIADCDFSQIRMIYMDYKRQVKNGIIIGVKSEIEEAMLQRNRIIRVSVQFYDQLHTKYTEKVKKIALRNLFKKSKEGRCQTADTLKKRQKQKEINQRITKPEQQQIRNKPHTSNKRLRTATNGFNRTPRSKSNKYSNINFNGNKTFRFIFNQNDEAKVPINSAMMQEFAEKKNNILKMNSISISNQTGKFELCCTGQKQQQHNKDRQKDRENLKMTVYNQKKRTFYRHIAVDTALKKRYDNYLINESSKGPEPASNRIIPVSIQERIKFAHSKKHSRVNQSKQSFNVQCDETNTQYTLSQLQTCRASSRHRKISFKDAKRKQKERQTKQQMRQRLKENEEQRERQFIERVKNQNLKVVKCKKSK